MSALLECLKDPAPNVRIAAAYGLGWMAEQSSIVVPALIETLDETNAGLVRTAAEALGRFGENASAAGPRLKELSRSRDPEVRKAVEKAPRYLSTQN